jgi:stearoyl-CoA desaturase (delta-9 desaturase)
VTAGMHRLWSHKSYKGTLTVRFFLMILASFSNQGSIYHWARDHRIHHKFSDSESDPHDISRGFFYAHIGWLLLERDKKVIDAGKKIMCDDLLNDPVVLLNYKLNRLWGLFWCFGVTGLYGIWKYNSFWEGMILFGALRWILEVHATWCVNSVSHSFGYRPYKDIPACESRFTSIVANGEGWHNWHHSYPYDYSCSEGGFLSQWNHTKILIDFLGLLGQTYDHRRKKLDVRKK